MPTEKEIISRIRSRARSASGVLVGIGDDAAVVGFPPDRDLLACCDSFVQDIHFRIEWTTPALIGHKALASTLSDIAAMGGTARFAMLSIALPKSTSATFVDELFDGILDLAEKYDVAIVGGDTSSSAEALFIDTSVIGECGKGKAVTRGGARPGDLVYVTGDLGASALALKLLEQGYRLDDPVTDEKSEAGRTALLKHLSPEPRLKFGHAIGAGGLATAMIDISDGLSTDLSHILEESGCGAVIRADRLPIADCHKALSPNECGFDPLRFSLHSGEEYELLFTSPPESEAEVCEVARSLRIAVTRIGDVVAGSGLVLEHTNGSEPITPSGWEHRI